MIFSHPVAFDDPVRQVLVGIGKTLDWCGYPTLKKA